jgi:hypothetical protein
MWNLIRRKLVLLVVAALAAGNAGAPHHDALAAGTGGKMAVETHSLIDFGDHHPSESEDSTSLGASVFCENSVHDCAKPGGMVTGCCQVSCSAIGNIVFAAQIAKPASRLVRGSWAEATVVVAHITADDPPPR